MYHLCILIACYIPPFVPMMFLSGWQNRNSDINMLEHVGTTYFLAKYFFIVLFTHGLYRLYAYYKYLDHHSNETHGRFLVLPHFC
jgi:NADH:ubiquinone oxidoreductase subunit H